MLMIWDLTTQSKLHCVLIPGPLRAKPGPGTKVKSGPLQSDKKMVRQNDKDNLPEEVLCCIEIDQQPKNGQ